MVAGEASGDLLGSQLILALRELVPALNVVGIGGPRMEAAGMDVWFPLEKLAVRGYFEVLKHFFEIVGIRPEEIRDSALVPESRRTACSTEQSSCVRLSGRS